MCRWRIWLSRFKEDEADEGELGASLDSKEQTRNALCNLLYLQDLYGTTRRTSSSYNRGI